MIGQICAEIKNYFCKECDKYIGDFEIIDGQLSPSLPIADGQYYRIVGSVFNDGVHISTEYLKDEGKFHGGVWLMRVPQEIIDLAYDIEAWKTANADKINSPYTSESFGGYSYTIASGASADGTVGLNWNKQAEFVARLKPYRRFRLL